MFFFFFFGNEYVHVSQWLINKCILFFEKGVLQFIIEHLFIFNMCF